MTKLEETEAAGGAAALTTILAGVAVAKVAGTGAATRNSSKSNSC